MDTLCPYGTLFRAVLFDAGRGAAMLSACDIARREWARYAPRSEPLFEAEREAERSAIHLRQHAPHEQFEVRVGQTGGVAGVDRYWPGFRPRPLCLQLDPGGVKPPARRLTGHAEGFRYADVAAEGGV